MSDSTPKPNHRFKFATSSLTIEIEGSPEFVNSMIEKYVPAPGTLSSRSEATAPIAVQSVRATSKSLSPAEYIRAKGPKSGTETIVVLGNYLEKHREMKSFKTADINAIASEAKLQAIHTQYFTNAVQQGLFRTISKGEYALTLSGEDMAEGMSSKEK